MGTSATLPRGGVYRWMWFSAFGWQLMISIRRLGGKSGSSLGSALEPNSSGFLVRDDRQPQTASVRTGPAPQLGLMSHWVRDPQTSLKPPGGA